MQLFHCYITASYDYLLLKSELSFDFPAPPPPSHQMKVGNGNHGTPSSASSYRTASMGCNSTSTSTSSSSSSNNGSPIKEIPSIGSTCNNRVSHSVSVPLHLFNAMHKPGENGIAASNSRCNGGTASSDQGSALPNTKDMDTAR